MTEEPEARGDFIDLAQLGEGMPGLTPALGGVQAEAASVCLERTGHGTIASLSVAGVWSAKFELAIVEVNNSVRRAYLDLQEATEWGATGVAILLARMLTGDVVVARSWIGTGFDYWLGRDINGLFQRTFLLEVSGILSGSTRDVRSRLLEKQTRIAQSKYGHLPAIVVIVEFSSPQARTGSHGVSSKTS